MARISPKQRLALELLADNRPIPASVAKSTLDSLVERRLATRSGPGCSYWITQAGRDALGPGFKPSAGKPSRRCACSSDCEATTRSIFAPGHDMRAVTRVARAMADDLTWSPPFRDMVLGAKSRLPAGASDTLATKAAQAAQRLLDRSSREPTERN